MRPTSRWWNGERPPRRFHAAMARRKASASPAVKSAASMAICITCSWKIGTPFVRPSAGLSSSGQSIALSGSSRFFR